MLNNTHMDIIISDKFEKKLKNKKIREAIKDSDAKEKASIKGYCIAKALKKKKYKVINGKWS